MRVLARKPTTPRSILPRRNAPRAAGSARMATTTVENNSAARLPLSFPGMNRGYGQNKSGTLTGFAFGGDITAMIQRNFSNDGQSHPRAFIFMAGVQPLENVEDAVEIFLVKADAIVTHRQPAKL